MQNKKLRRWKQCDYENLHMKQYNSYYVMGKQSNCF